MRAIRRHVYDVLRICKEQIWLILSYSIAIGIFTLIIPISAQSLVNIVSYGAIVQPVVVLAIIIFILLTASSIFRIMLVIIVEVIQQKIFTLIALNIAKHLTHISMSAYCKIQGTGLTNYFFEIITIQKAIAKLILYSIEMVMLILLSMTLLAFYHPILFAFDCILIVALLITFYFPFKRSVLSAVDESTAKHKVAAWLDEISFYPTLFRFQQTDSFALSETDKHILSYLKYRYAHFKNILFHHIGANIIYVLSTTSLLVIGGYLVIKQQLTLGQLVATEILLSLIVSNLIKLSSHFENLYDLIAASNKIGTIFDLPTDHKPSDNSSLPLLNRKKENYALEVKELTLPQVSTAINFKLSPNESIAIIDVANAKRSKLIDTFAGLNTNLQGMIKYDDILQQDYPVKELQSQICLLRNIEIFNGTISQNILLGNSHLESNLHYWINYFGLDEVLAALPAGIHSTVHPANTVGQASFEKIMLIRTFINKPRLLLIDGFLDDLAEDLLHKSIFALTQGEAKTTLVVITNNKQIANQFKQQIFL